MSCVAEAMATAKAQATKGPSSCEGSFRAMPTRPSAMTSCDTSSQLRLRPNCRVSQGMGMRSTSGAHIHFTP